MRPWIPSPPNGECVRVRGADGTEYKPADYLAAFSEFVTDNPAHIDAIGILLKRPKDVSFREACMTPGSSSC